MGVLGSIPHSSDGHMLSANQGLAGARIHPMGSGREVASVPASMTVITGDAALP